MESPNDPRLHQQLKTESHRQSLQYKRALRKLRLPVTEAKEQLDKLLKNRAISKQRRKELSNSLQAAFMAEHSLLNFKQEQKSVEDAILDGLPFRQGVGECAAPKLLADAARRGIQPLAMAEVWAGAMQSSIPGPERVRGVTYPPCEERCKPILGHLLCGSDQAPSQPQSALKVLDEGDSWVAIQKIGGMLSVEGRGSDKVDSVLTRVRTFHPRGANAKAAHRLDYETSGVQLIALTNASIASLQAQFAKRETAKTYLAWVEGSIANTEGQIDAPIRPVGRHVRGQEIHPEGKAALTNYKVLGEVNGRTLVALSPKTGRTHQLRVHCAQTKDIGRPIVGDNLYGSQELFQEFGNGDGDGKDGPELLLHAWRLQFKDPDTGQAIQVEAAIPESWPEDTSSLLHSILAWDNEVDSNKQQQQD